MSRLVISLLSMFMLTCGSINISITPQHYNYEGAIVYNKAMSFQSDDNIIMPIFMRNGTTCKNQKLNFQNKGVPMWVSPMLFLSMTIVFAVVYKL